MKIKCDSCIHKKVCKFRPKEDYPQFMKRIASDTASILRRTMMKILNWCKEHIVEIVTAVLKKKIT